MEKRECPKEVNGLPVVCTWVEGWQKKMAEFIDKKQDFVLTGKEEYLRNVKKAYCRKSVKEFIELILLGGAGAVALPGVSATSLGTALGLSCFATADPEPVSKTIFIAIVAAIVGVTAAILIWKLFMALRMKIDFKVESNVPGIPHAVEVHFESEPASK